MKTVFISQGAGKAPLSVDSDRGARVGRWAFVPDGGYPDRCSCFDPKTMLSGIAAGYYTERITRGTRKATVRRGVCLTCAPKGHKVHWYEVKE